MWKLDLKAPNLLGQMREVLTHFFSEALWRDFAGAHVHGIARMPALGQAKHLAAGYLSKSDWRSLYFLEAVIQGAMEEHAQHLIVRADGNRCECKLCGHLVVGSPWLHAAYQCKHIQCLDEEAIQATNFLSEQALQAESDKAKWLRGLVPQHWPDHKEIPDPLSLNYEYTSSYGHMDVTGLIAAGDGSGGAHNRDPRIRKCGFGLSIVRPNHDHTKVDYVAHALGEVPGVPTVPRAEMVVLWHFLRTTSGSCTYIADNLQVAKQYAKGPSFNPKANGLLWQQINQAKLSRNGHVTVIWMPSHTSLEAAVKQGYHPSYWFANRLADSLAGDAAAARQLDSIQVTKYKEELEHMNSILLRLVSVALAICPSKREMEESRQAARNREHGPRVPKEERALLLAKQAGHLLNGSGTCTLCGLRVNFSKNLAYLECILNMRCFGRLNRDSLTLHSLPKSNHRLDPEDTEHYLFHGVRVHQSHAMATHWDLQIHFCTFCGAYSQYRSRHLAKPCTLAPTKQGRENLHNILLGKRPDRHVTSWKYRHSNSKARQGTKPAPKPKARPRPLSKRAIMRTIQKRPARVMPPPDFTCKAAPPSLVPLPGACPQCKGLGGEQLGRCICDDIAVADLNGDSFSIGKAKEPVVNTPNNAQGVLPSPSVQATPHLACPKHRFGRAWTIQEYCAKCDSLALAALESTGRQ